MGRGVPRRRRRREVPHHAGPHQVDRRARRCCPTPLRGDAARPARLAGHTAADLEAFAEECKAPRGCRRSCGSATSRSPGPGTSSTVSSYLWGPTQQKPLRPLALPGHRRGSSLEELGQASSRSSGWPMPDAEGRRQPAAAPAATRRRGRSPSTPPRCCAGWRPPRWSTPSDRTARRAGVDDGRRRGARPDCEATQVAEWDAGDGAAARGGAARPRRRASRCRCRPACRRPRWPRCATTPTRSPRRWPGRCRGSRRRRPGSAPGSTPGSRPGSAQAAAGRPRRAARPRRRRGRRRRRPAGAGRRGSRRGRSPTGARWRSSRRSRWCSAARWCAAGSTRSTEDDGGRLPRRRLEDQPAADRRPAAARALPAGLGGAARRAARAGARGVLLRARRRPGRARRPARPAASRQSSAADALVEGRLASTGDHGGFGRSQRRNQGGQHRVERDLDHVAEGLLALQRRGLLAGEDVVGDRADRQRLAAGAARPACRARWPPSRPRARRTPPSGRSARGAGGRRSRC